MKKWIVFLLSVAVMGMIFWSCSDEDGSPKPEPPTYINEGVIGDIGGTVKIEDASNPLNGAFVNIPEGALTTDETIKISVDDSGLRLPGDSTAVFVKLEPEGLTFDEPIEIAIPFPEGSTPENLTVYYFDQETGEVHQLPISGIDYEKGVVKGMTDHFSYYTASDNGITLKMETIDLSGKVGVRFNMPNYYSIPGRWNLFAWLGFYYFDSGYSRWITQFDATLCKGWYGDDIETKKMRIDCYVSGWTYVIDYYVRIDGTWQKKFQKLNVQESDLKKWVDGSAFICKFDTNIDTGSDYYVKFKMDVNSKWDGDGIDAYTWIYNFSGYDNRMKIGEMPDFSNDKNNNFIDDNFDGYQPPVNNPPTCTLTSPSNNASFTKGTKITVSANASDTDGISYVTFYADGESIGGDINYPYSCYYYTNYASTGYHSVEAVAVDKRVYTVRNLK